MTLAIEVRNLERIYGSGEKKVVALEATQFASPCGAVRSPQRAIGQWQNNASQLHRRFRSANSGNDS